jgi:GxxExxY protein
MVAQSFSKFNTKSHQDILNIVIEKDMTEENEISRIILDCAYKVHTKLGSGLLEKVYRECLAYELTKCGLEVKQEKAFPVVYEDIKMDCGYRVDIIVNNKVIVELKVVEEFTLEHTAQCLTYMRLSECRLGLLLNFYKKSLKDGIKRLIL